jgi:hypothetical protein
MILGKVDHDGVWRIVHPDLLRACDGDEEQLANWWKVLRANDVFTVQDWKIAKMGLSFDSAKYGDVLVGLLDKLAVDLQWTGNVCMP